MKKSTANALGELVGAVAALFLRALVAMWLLDAVNETGHIGFQLPSRYWTLFQVLFLVNVLGSSWRGGPKTQKVQIESD